MQWLLLLLIGIWQIKVGKKSSKIVRTAAAAGDDIWVNKLGGGHSKNKDSKNGQAREIKEL